MQLFLILLLTPVWGLAQPVAINHDSIAGYIRADLGGGPDQENVLLAYDNEGAGLRALPRFPARYWK